MLGRMRQPVKDELQHVLVGQRVKQVLAFASTGDDIVGPQHPQALRDGCNRLRFQLRQFTHTSWTLHQPGDDTQPCRVAQRTKDASAALQRAFRNLQRLWSADDVIFNAAGRL